MLNPLAGLLSKGVLFLDDLIGTSKLDYTFSERVSLVKARLFRRDKTGLLGFKVAKSGERSFQIIVREIFFKGEYKFRAEVEAPVIFDCGANIGLATLYFKYIYPKSHITAFEADPENVRVLNENIANNRLENVTVHGVMLAGHDGEATFYSGSGPAGDLLGSTNPNRDSNPRQVKLRAAKLSGFVDRQIDLLKLDVEGAEFDVLTDLIESGKINGIKRMVIEYHHRIDGVNSCLARFLKLLEEQGFEYQLAASCGEPVGCQNGFQDILIGAYRGGDR